VRSLAVFRRVLSYYRHHLPATVAGSLAVVASAVIGLAAPGIVRQAVDALAQGKPLSVVLRAALLLLAVTFLAGVFLFLQRRLLVAVSRHLEHRLRTDLYHHLLSLPASFYLRERVGDILTRATSDIAAVRMAVGPALMYALNTLTVMVVSTVLMLRIDLFLTVLSLAVVPLVGATTRLFSQHIHSRWTRAQEALSDYTARLQEHLVGLRVLRAYGCEEGERAALAQRSHSYLLASKKLIVVQAAFQPLLQTLVGLSFVLVLGFGGAAVRAGRITLGQFVELNLYLVRLIWPMIAIGWVATLLQRGAASASRIEQLFAELPIPDRGGSRHVSAASGPASLEVRNLSFSFPHTTRLALDGVTLVLRPGERLALVGEVGSGKSTLLSLPPRLLEPPPGTVFLDGVDVLDYPLQELRTCVALVPQGSFLFSATLRENIALARPDATHGEILTAALAAGLEEDLARMPEGLDTVVGERGVTLSGGQRQRVSIARALLTRPRLLLLDDCLSSVDAQTERVILSSLPDTTLVVATHRLAAAELCQQVAVLEGGRIVEMGSPAELALRRGRYARLLALQGLLGGVAAEAM